MSFIRATAVRVIAVCMCAIPAFAQRNTCQQRVIPVSIGTTNGERVPQLESSNLKGTFRKKPIHITSIAINQEPVRVLLLLDTSGSMHGIVSASVKNFSVVLAEDLAINMPPASEIGLGFFSKELVPVLPPTTDRRTLNDQLEALNSNPSSFRGKTALWDAIHGSIKMFDHPHLGDVVYLITDGGKNSGKITLDQIVQRFGEGSVRLFVFVIQNHEGGTTEELTGPEEVAEIADDTGGATVVSKGDFSGDLPVTHETALVKRSGQPTELGLSLASQYRQISSFYRVSIDLPETVDKPREWKLDLAGFKRSERENLVLAYPHMLIPCH